MYKMMYKIEDDAGPAQSRYNGKLLAKFARIFEQGSHGEQEGAFSPVRERSGGALRIPKG
jgi:hypothetical protein